LGQFQFHDLVNLDVDTVGVIIRLEKDYVEVLNMHGAVVRVKAVSIQPRKNPKFAKAFDAAGNTLQAGDLIRVTDSAQVCFIPIVFIKYSDDFSMFLVMMMMSELAKSNTFSGLVFLYILAKL
jgi:hypothetical protein